MQIRKTHVAAMLLVAASATGFAYFNVADKDGGPGADMTASATAFIGTLNEEQRKITVLNYDSPKRVDWHFIPKKTRKGFRVSEMSKDQRKAAFNLLKASLSKIGYSKATDIMKLEALLFALEEKAGSRKWDRDSQKYYFTIFGTPDAKKRWGLSIEGHHLSLNFVVENNDVISSTPTFLAANPGLVMNEMPKQLPKGTRVLAKEETLAFDLLASLDKEQRQQAVIAEKAPAEIRDPGTPQPPQAAAEGIAVSDLNADQQKILKNLVTEYARSMPKQVAGARIEAIAKAGVEKVHFAWAGADKPGVGHYYRVQGPTFLIEFVNTQPDAAGNPANHIHCVWRDLAFGDFALPLAK